MEKQYKLSDRVSKDSLKSPTFKKWLKRILCAVCIISLVLQLTLCCLPMQASAHEDYSAVGTWVFNPELTYGGTVLYFNIDFVSNGTSYKAISVGSFDMSYITLSGGSQSAYIFSSKVWGNNKRTIEITGGDDVNSEALLSFLNSSAVKQFDGYDFTGEYRLFNEQLTNLSFSQAGTVTQSYAFDFNIWGGYNADYFHVQADGSSVDISYAFTDEGSGGIKTVYRQLLRDGEIVGTWLVPRARLIYFQSNPEDPTFQQWLLDNTVLIDESMIESVYSFGYDNGYNDGWTNSAIGDTLKAPVEALNNIILLDIAGVTITLGGVIFTMVVLSVMLIFLKKYAGG